MERYAPPAGVLLVNLGSPDAPETRAVRSYLREFLGDPRVIDLPALARWLLLNLVILPFRPRRSAEAYAAIWTPEGSPLVLNGEALRDALVAELGGDWRVALAMRYGRPSIDAALDALAAEGADPVVVVPLFPHYASAATGSAVAQVYARAAERTVVPSLRVVEPFYEAPDFVEAVAEAARPTLEEAKPDYVLFSYHGLPERQVRACDTSGRHCLARADCCEAIVAANRACYRAQCYATTRAVARELGLAADAHGTAFQSRLGRTPWIRPYTDEVLPELAGRGVRRLAVLCPSFAADCLETLEEIGIRAREQWASLGGEHLALVPCVNAHPAWVRGLGALVRAYRDPAETAAPAGGQTLSAAQARNA